MFPSLIALWSLLSGAATNPAQSHDPLYYFTLSLLYQCEVSNRADLSYILAQVTRQINDKIFYFRELCKQNNWEVPAEVPSNCITGFFVRRNGDILFKELLKQEIFIMPGGTPNYFRVSHLGVQTNEDLDDLARRIKEIENR